MPSTESGTTGTPDENPDDLPFQSTHDINLLDVQLMKPSAVERREFSKGEGIGGSIITSHPFDPPEGREWACCTHCGLAEAAHADALRRYVPDSPRGVPDGEPDPEAPVTGQPPQ